MKSVRIEVRLAGPDLHLVEVEGDVAIVESQYIQLDESDLEGALIFPADWLRRFSTLLMLTQLTQAVFSEKLAGRHAMRRVEFRPMQYGPHAVEVLSGGLRLEIHSAHVALALEHYMSGGIEAVRHWFDLFPQRNVLYNQLVPIPDDHFPMQAQQRYEFWPNIPRTDYFGLCDYCGEDWGGQVHGEIMCQGCLSEYAESVLE